MVALQKLQPGMVEIKTIESDRYEKAEDGIHVKYVGMIKAQDAFDQLKAHLEKVGLLPDEYFNLNDWKWKGETELPCYIRASCDVNWGGSEGIYLDISLLHRENNEIKYFSFATGKTLGETGDDFLRMSRIAAECSMMLNGRGSIVRVSESAYDNIQLTTEEKGLIAKALDFAGDRVADTQGYSAGEKFWELKEKFKPIANEEPNEFLKGKSSAFVEVYNLVKEAHSPYDGKALSDIYETYGYDLYKEVLDVLVKEEAAQLYTRMQKAYEDDLPEDIAKDKLTPDGFYDFICNHADSEFPYCQELKSTLDRLNLSFADDEFIEIFDNIQNQYNQYKPSLSSQIQSAELKSSNTTIPNKETEPTR